jgi:DNA modification methylase
MRTEPVILESKSTNSLARESAKHTFNELLMSDLDFKNSSNNNLRHFWHAFPAKFPPEIPRLFIENLTQEGDMVLDPMAGSCTTLLEAVILQRDTIGFEIDPLSLILGQAKFQHFKPEVPYQTGNSLIHRAVDVYRNHRDVLENELKERFDKETLNFLDYWFSKEAQLELSALLREIESLEDDAIKQFLRLVFSGIIITKNGGVTRARDLAHTRPHRVLSKTPPSAFPEFSKKLFKNLHNLEKIPSSKVCLAKANAKAIPLEDKSVDLIVTSPPYANNAIDYMRAHKFSLVWFGYKISQLTNIRRNYIGAEALVNIDSEALPDFSHKKVIQLKERSEKKGKVLHRYFTEMSGAIKEMYRVLKHERACAIVVASSVLCGLDVETHRCLADIGNQHGFEVVHIGARNIDRNKRMLPTSHFRNNSQIETRMHKEYVLGLWKP